MKCSGALTSEARPRSPREVIVSESLTREQALARLTPALASSRYEVTRTLEDDELYVSRFPLTRVIVKVVALTDGKTRFRVRPDEVWWYPQLHGWLVTTKQVAEAIDVALN